MAYVEFNFKHFHRLFLEAIASHEPSIAFTVADGKGKFTFLLFLETDSEGRIKWGDLELFIILGRTQNVLNLKLLGNHKNAGDFKIRFEESDIEAIRNELGILTPNSDAAQPFSFPDFLQKLHQLFPLTLTLEDKITAIQENKGLITAHCSRYIEDAKKVYLLGKRELSRGKPQEETLRKLYMLNVNPKVIAGLIRGLKLVGWTVAWTDKKPGSDQFDKLWNAVVAKKSDQTK